MQANKKLLILRFITIFLAGTAIFFIWQSQETDRDGGGQTLDPLSELIQVYEPTVGQVIKSPVTVTGEARGYWFFEADFPVKIYDDNGNELGIAIAQAQDEWMTEEFVPFRTILYFKKSSTSTGYLVFHKHNASGLPEHDDELRIPIKFDLTGAADNCRPTGCSGQICSDEDVITTCEFRPEYACYQNAICERQSDGECGWTQNSELLSCLDSLE